MNNTLKNRIEAEARRTADRYNPHTSQYSSGKHFGHIRGFAEGAKYALSRQWIGVDEALPESDSTAFMNVYAKIDTGHGVEHCVLLATYASGKFSCETTHVKVVAWMTIPEYGKEGKQ